MRRTAIALMATTAIGLYLGASAASAADMGMPLKAPPPMPAPVYNWTGCYIGGQVGVGVQQDNFVGGSNGANGWGAVAGGQIGCNYQTGMLVVGIEGDGLWSGMNNSEGFSEGVGESFSEGAKNKWDADVTLRLGAAFDRLLIYGKGGVAWGGFNFSEGSTVAGISEGANGSITLPGALIGLGFEYAPPAFPHWTVKAEYNYIAYAQRQVTFTETLNGVATGGTFTENLGATKQIIKVGLNYKFTGP